MTTLTPETFDALARSARHTHAREERIIWTAAAIGQRIGRSEDYVRKTLANTVGGPVRHDGRRLYAFEDQLIAWFRDTPEGESQ